MSQHSHCHTIYYVGKFIKKRHVAKPWPSFVVDTYVREKNPFLETFLWHYLNLSQKHFQNSAFISRRGKARNHSDESFEFAIKFVFVDDFVRKFGFVDDLVQKKKSFLLFLLNLCFIFLLLFCFICGLEKDWNEYNEDGSKIDREKKKKNEKDQEKFYLESEK